MGFELQKQPSWGSRVSEAVPKQYGSLVVRKTNEMK